MKLLITVLGDQDAEPVLDALVEAELRATRISSSGAFLHRSNTTLLIGLEDDKVEQAIELIRNHTKPSDDSGQRRATVFVLDVGRYLQL